ncbi:MAG: hypothetical protein COY19_04930 [Candidatus Marinimicrobia bacterium CG_4_10_14_0_2_um_filter_48_9]|nr:MAG: hypothetical protein COY19_04930 [Candidatus Marinimicrobia bacterium CG_4_10_14_0_2_um_filter_48_9]
MLIHRLNNNDILFQKPIVIIHLQQRVQCISQTHILQVGGNRTHHLFPGDDIQIILFGNESQNIDQLSFFKINGNSYIKLVHLPRPGSSLPFNRCRYPRENQVGSVPINLDVHNPVHIKTDLYLIATGKHRPGFNTINRG